MMITRKGMFAPVLLFSAVLMTGILSCKGKADTNAIVVWRVGNVELQRQGETPRQLELKQIVKQGDRIRSSAQSFAVIQVGESVTVRIQPDTTVDLTALMDPSKKELSLAEGQILSKVQKLNKNESYAVRMPTALAAVRGTEFSSTYRSGQGVVAVAAGKVVVEVSGKAAEKTPGARTVADGMAVVISDEVRERPIEKSESLEIQLVSIIPVMRDAESKSVQEIETIDRQLMEQQKKIEDQLKDAFRPKSLDEIKAKFERIDEVTLYNGRVIRGVIVSRGAEYKILTPEGQLTVPSSQVKKTQLMK